LFIGTCNVCVIAVSRSEVLQIVQEAVTQRQTALVRSVTDAADVGGHLTESTAIVDLRLMLQLVYPPHNELADIQAFQASLATAEKEDNVQVRLVSTMHHSSIAGRVDVCKLVQLSAWCSMSQHKIYKGMQHCKTIWLACIWSLQTLVCLARNFSENSLCPVNFAGTRLQTVPSHL
jgi:hypothetical protein